MVAVGDTREVLFSDGTCRNAEVVEVLDEVAYVVVNPVTDSEHVVPYDVEEA